MGKGNDSPMIMNRAYKSFGNNKRPISISSTVKNNDDSKSKYNYDTLSEILMRVDFYSLFNCILVSKEWLSIVTAPDFRTNYLNSGQILGFLIDCSHYLPTCPAGMLLRSSIPKDLLSKSPEPAGLKLYGDVATTSYRRWYVRNSKSGEPVDLPTPIYSSTFDPAINILQSSDDGAGFKVILASSSGTMIIIHTFCSRAWEWESSILTCPTSLRGLAPLMGKGGAVARRGDVIYWKATKDNNAGCLAAWDVNESCVTVIPEPPFMKDVKIDGQLFRFSTTYGVSPQPQGSLLAATCSYNRSDNEYEWESDGFTINIWALDDDKKDWRLLHSVTHESMWIDNLALLTSLFEARPEFGFKFVSFVPGRSDSIFVGLERRLFIHHFCTGELEHVEYFKSGYVEYFSAVRAYQPVTVMDLGLGIFPSPPSLQAPSLIDVFSD